MELKDFVSGTLRQVLAEIQDAQAYAAENGGRVVPGDAVIGANSGIRMVSRRDESPIGEIDFDVALTVVEGKATKGGAGFFVGPVGIGAHGQESASNQSTSRIKFTVPVMYPRQDEQGREIAPAKHGKNDP